MAKQKQQYHPIYGDNSRSTTPTAQGSPAEHEPPSPGSDSSKDNTSSISLAPVPASSATTASTAACAATAAAAASTCAASATTIKRKRRRRQAHRVAPPRGAASTADDSVVKYERLVKREPFDSSNAFHHIHSSGPTTAPPTALDADATTGWQHGEIEHLLAATAEEKSDRFRVAQVNTGVINHGANTAHAWPGGPYASNSYPLEHRGPPPPPSSLNLLLTDNDADTAAQGTHHPRSFHPHGRVHQPGTSAHHPHPHDHSTFPSRPAVPPHKLAAYTPVHTGGAASGHMRAEYQYEFVNDYGGDFGWSGIAEADDGAAVGLEGTEHTHTHGGCDDANTTNADCSDLPQPRLQLNLGAGSNAADTTTTGRLPPAS
jgi:hypothetical protein